MSRETSDGPLQGVKVVEFGQLIAGPCVGTLLGDFGADVVKVEPPGVVPKLSGTPGRIRRPARWTVGADTDDVLAELGFTENGDEDSRGSWEGTA